jgi:diacylglycerol O-acyltransferase
MTLRRLTGLDAAFLSAEHPGNLLHMMGVLVLDPSSVPGGYTFERFRDFLALRLPALTPLRRRLVEVPGGLAPPLWTEEAAVDVDLHLRRAAVPSPGGPRELAAMAAEMLERPLDRSRPLWEMAMVEGLAGGRLAVLAKVHHAMMDGMAGMKLMASLFATTPELGEAPRVVAREPDRVPGRVELLVRAVPWLLRQPRRAAWAGLRTTRSTLGRVGRALSGGSGPKAPPVHVSRSWFNVEVTPYRAVALQSLALADLREIGHAAGASVNDVMLAVVGGALRSYLTRRGVPTDAPLVAGVPLAVRGEGDERANAVTSVSVGLATDLADPAERLRAIHAAMTAHKGQRGGTLGEDLAAWADVPPPLVFSLISSAYIELHLGERLDPICNVIVSSVPGPPETLYLAGARLVGIHPLGPVYSGVALNVTAIGCGESLDIGLVACRGRMPDLWDLADAVPAALAELRAAVGAQPRAARAG